MVKEYQNISRIASQRLCTSCGACLGVCPIDAIHFEETTGGYYLPVVDDETCTRCGICYDVCPGVHFGKTLMSKMPVDSFVGSALDTFVGKSTSEDLFNNSQSGGIVSALLVHALATGRIRGAVTVVMQPGRPPRPMVQIATSREEISRAQKSKYCPVPVLGVLRDLQKMDGPIALVGTACQIHGMYNVLDRLPELKTKIAFTVGLVCERVLVYSAIDYFLSKTSFKSKKVELYFKDKILSGYPGNVHVFSSEGDSAAFPASERMRIKNYFTPARCRICFDKMNVFADITAGDPHGLKNIDRVNGESMLAIRTKVGEDIVHAAEASGAIAIRHVEYDQVLSGQRIARKKEQWKGYAMAWEKMGRELPAVCSLLKQSVADNHNSKKYVTDLGYSLKLDQFADRMGLIRFVRRAIRKEKSTDLFLTPFRFVRWGVKKSFKLTGKLTRCW